MDLIRRLFAWFIAVAVAAVGIFLLVVAAIATFIWLLGIFLIAAALVAVLYARFRYRRRHLRRID